MLHTFISFIRRKTSQKYRFDKQFESGVWEGLKHLPELGRYSVIAGYIGFFFEQPKVLDLGCGEGVLCPRLKYKSYKGIDFSEVAIQNANQCNYSNATFEVGDLNKLTVDENYDAIVYNESLYYLNQPIEKVMELVPHLNPGGIFIFSIVDKHGKENEALWTPLNQSLSLVDRTKIVNNQGHCWTIQVYKAK